MSIYHYTDQVTGEALVFGSLVAIAENSSLTENQLRYQFTGLKKTTYSPETKTGFVTHVIHKLPGIIRSKRKN